MRALFSSLVAASLLIHAAIGCCWHHAHAETCCDDSQCDQPGDVDCDHHHGEPSDHSHGPCKDHCHGTCHYLPVQKAQVDTQFVHTLDFAAVVPATCDLHVVVLLHADGTHEAAAKPPMRLHLFQQLLLI